MLQTFKLLLPALIPSWRFFDEIAPSPRIEFTLLETTDTIPRNWQEFRPRPPRVSVSDMLKRLFWNPRWNESLFLVSCAERLMQHPTRHSEREIIQRIKAELQCHAIAAPYFQFRLIFVSRQGTELQTHVTFASPIYPCSGEADHESR